MTIRESDRTIIIPIDVFVALQKKAKTEADRVGKGDINHPVATLITPRSLAQKVLRTFAERKCEGYVPSKSKKVRGRDE